MKFIELTKYDGNKVYINKNHISSFSTYKDHYQELERSNVTVRFKNEFSIDVKESYEEIKKIMEEKENGCCSK